VLCLIIFLAFLGLLGAIFGLAFATGDWAQLLYDQDYLGNRCGVGDKAALTKTFYPRIPRDMIDQPDIVKKGEFWKLKLYGLCVKECPKTFNIANPSSSMVTDYGYDPTKATTQAFGKYTQATWLSATPTVDIVNRCIPRTESSQSKTGMCAYPKCDAPEVIAAGGTCYNTGSFVNGEWSVCGEVGSGSVSASDCATQQEVCKVKVSETTTTAYALNVNDEASAAMLASVAGTVGGVFEIVSAIAKAWYMILVGGVAAPIALAFMFMVLLFLFAQIIIYTLLIILIICELGATIICLSKSGISFQGKSANQFLAQAQSATNVSLPGGAQSALAAVNEESRWVYAVAFLILAIVTFITILTVVTSRKKIRICAAIVKEATTVFTSMPLLMLFPSFSTLVQVVVCAWFVVTCILIYTTKAAAMDVALGLAVNTTSPSFISLGVSPAAGNVDPLGTLRSFLENDNATTIMLIIVLYGFFVLIQFVGGIAWCTMSSSVYYWYFFKKNTKEQLRMPIASSLARSLFFHTGSVAFSAFVIAFCDMLRAAAAYLEKQMGPTNNFMVKLAFKVLNCCLACLKKTVKFISYYGLVWVACQGTSFCSGCFKTFFFFLQNPGQVAINALVTWLLKWISLLSMPLACAVTFYYIMDSVMKTAHASYPAAIIFVIAALMTSSCMSVFDCTITTIFVCCFQDKAEFQGRFMADDHKRLAKAFGIKIPKGESKAASTNEPETSSADADAVQSL
jgi:choline transporter-like protein 2/4/5